MSKKKVKSKPLGSDINITMQDMPDLEGFLQKEKVMIANKQKDLIKELHTVEKMESEFKIRIDELDSLIHSNKDEASSVFIKLTGKHLLFKFFYPL